MCTRTCTCGLLAVCSLNIFCNFLSSNSRRAQSIHYSLPGGGGSCDGEPDRQHLQQTVIWIITKLSSDSSQIRYWNFQLHSEMIPLISDLIKSVLQSCQISWGETTCTLYIITEENRVMYIYMACTVHVLHVMHLHVQIMWCIKLNV